MKTNEAFPARETNPVGFAKLEGYNSKTAETSCAEVAGPDQAAVKQMTPGTVQIKSTLGSPGIQTKPPPLETNLLEDN